MFKRSLLRFLNNLKLHNKFVIMYIFCVIIPLVITDTIVFYSMFSKEYNNRRFEMNNVAIGYQNVMSSMINYDINIINAISENKALRQFLDRDYENSGEYMIAYNDFIVDSFFQTLTGMRNEKITVYSDNPTIYNGKYFKRLSSAKTMEWYDRFISSGRSETLLIYYDNDVDARIESNKKIMFVKRFKNMYDSKYDKVATVEINNINLQSEILQFSDVFPMYICCGNYVAITKYGEGVTFLNVEEQEALHRHSVHHSFTIAGTRIDIHIYSDDYLISGILADNFLIIIGLLIATLVLPVVIMKLIEETIDKRINKLGEAFSGNSTDKFQPISDIEGNDEISLLMSNYNNIVKINNNLINTLYKDKLREQENDLARKNAELLALQSQINPHFLFNALESIRMHSLLRGEDETADMVEKLAVLERQNVEWGNDLVTIKKETESIEAYLYLQSYRFGDRLSFDIDIEKDCENYMIPKLTLVTFVENACVHGIESKSSAGWIFVRVYKKNDDLCMEVEDTGGGMSDAEIASLVKNIDNVSIEQIKGKKHVGILNACLRLKMHSENEAVITIDSEVGVGMCVLIRVPLNKLTINKE